MRNPMRNLARDGTVGQFAEVTALGVALEYRQELVVEVSKDRGVRQPRQLRPATGLGVAIVLNADQVIEQFLRFLDGQHGSGLDPPALRGQRPQLGRKRFCVPDARSLRMAVFGAETLAVPRGLTADDLIDLDHVATEFHQRDRRPIEPLPRPRVAAAEHRVAAAVQPGQLPHQRRAVALP